MVASLVEVVMFRYARRTGALQRPMPDDVYRHYMLASLLPVGVFLISIPVAVLNAAVAMVMWIAIFPLERLFARTAAPTASAWEQQAAGAED
jgi:hypothetical protein